MSDFDSGARKAADAVRQQRVENTPDHEHGIRRGQRSPGRAAIPRAVAGALLIGGVVVALPLGGGDGGTSLGRGGTAVALTGTLKPFDSCHTVLQYFKDQAPEFLIERAGGGDVAYATGAGVPLRAAEPQQGLSLIHI